jgi:hypothetical protein
VPVVGDLCASDAASVSRLSNRSRSFPPRKNTQDPSPIYLFIPKPHSRYLHCARMFCCRLFSGSRRTGFRFSSPILPLRTLSSVVSRGTVYIFCVSCGSLKEMDGTADGESAEKDDYQGRPPLGEHESSLVMRGYRVLTPHHQHSP